MNSHSQQPITASVIYLIGVVLTNITQLMQISLLIYDYRVFPGLFSKVSSFYQAAAGLIRHHFWDIPDCLKTYVKKENPPISCETRRILRKRCGDRIIQGLKNNSQTRFLGSGVVFIPSFSWIWLTFDCLYYQHKTVPSSAWNIMAKTSEISIYLI